MTQLENRVKRRRMPAEERRAQIIAAAVRLFSERGFGVSTRTLAEHLGITQAALYRHFKSKSDIVDAVFAHVILDNWDAALNERLINRLNTLGVRLTEFYQGFARRFTDESMRLFMRASLDGLPFPDRYSSALNQRILEPVIAELRYEAGLPGISEQPVTRGERELALMLHGSIVFLGIRRHIYRMPLPGDLDQHIALYVGTFAAGAIDELRRVHSLPSDHPFALPMATAHPRKGP